MRAISPQGANLHITNYDGSSYKISAEAPAEFLLKLAVPYHSGWTATVDGGAVQVFAVNEALCGVFVPAGNHTIEFQFHAAGFAIAATLSLLKGHSDLRCTAHFSLIVHPPGSIRAIWSQRPRTP